MGPDRLVVAAAVRVRPGKAVEILETLVSAVRVTFDVVEEVARIRLGQQVEPAPLARGEEVFVSRQCTRVVLLARARIELESRLGLQLAQGVDVEVIDDEVVGRSGELSECGDSCFDECLTVRIGESGDEREVVHLAPRAIAVLVPATDGAEVDGDRLGRTGEAVEHGSLEVVLDAPVVGRHFVEANGDLALLDGTGDDVDVLGILVLDLAKVFRVGAELEDRVYFGDTRELRVLWFKGE